MSAFRVFVSYSHEDRDKAAKVVRALRRMGHEPLWDDNIRPGAGFTEAIQGLITHAHVFLPLLTATSQGKPWVHQETGYAIALRIPVLPVVVGKLRDRKVLPAQMMAHVQAVEVRADFRDVGRRLREVDLSRLVFPAPPVPPLTQIADWPEKRAELLAECSERVEELAGCQRVRQLAALSSFSLPDEDVRDPVWKLREGGHPRTRYYRLLQRKERQALERHARGAGCDLILTPRLIAARLGGGRAKARLATLRDFLDSMPDDKVRIVTYPRLPGQNLTMVGDWFVAESLTPRAGHGYRQTTFSWHAPSVSRWVRKFDRDFTELAACCAWTLPESREAVVALLDEAIAELDEPAPRRHPRAARKKKTRKKR